ncbi:hypothetical protein LY28_02807 [Ruminiclostridium sufflavum DSM 19573]|uniref:Uncharacterized protein n=1 Tax=Ruminiclostridium sufflavum DSM 19573 TaxID=1121337 RepID=A0A318Y414_9FIRM|nr:hypothetical protein [Ruminiclostridium sufflavum]PYG86781.1 hypothetical protein LY28_02807 [Ruminiclostridium sufflavum DSM 19573]
MNEREFMEVVPFGNGFYKIVNRKHMTEIALFRVSPNSSFVLDTELANSIIDAYLKYYRAVNRRIQSFR